MGAVPPDRELYRDEIRGVERELAHIYRERDMKADYETFMRVKTKEEAAAQQAQLRGLLLLTVLSVGITCLAIAILW